MGRYKRTWIYYEGRWMFLPAFHPWPDLVEDSVGNTHSIGVCRQAGSQLLEGRSTGPWTSMRTNWLSPVYWDIVKTAARCKKTSKQQNFAVTLAACTGAPSFLNMLLSVHGSNAFSEICFRTIVPPVLKRLHVLIFQKILYMIAFYDMLLSHVH